MNDIFLDIIPFLKEQLVAVQEIRHQNPPLEVVEGPSDLGRLEVDSRLVIPANTHLKNIVTSAHIAHSVAPSEEGVTVLPQMRPLGGQSEAAETASTGQNRAVEQAGPSSRQWETKSPSNLNSSDWRSLARCFESLPEPGDEASSLPPAQEALPQQPPVGSGSDRPSSSIPHSSHSHAATLTSNEMRAINCSSLQLIEKRKTDKCLTQTYRTALIKQEKIILVISRIFFETQLSIANKEDIRRGVDIALTDLMQDEIGYRNQRLSYILRDLEKKGSTSKFFKSILSDIKLLD